MCCPWYEADLVQSIAFVAIVAGVISLQRKLMCYPWCEADPVLLIFLMIASAVTVAGMISLGLR
jgi:hypothetical protein